MFWIDALKFYNAFEKAKELARVAELRGHLLAQTIEALTLGVDDGETDNSEDDDEEEEKVVHGEETEEDDCKKENLETKETESSQEKGTEL